MDKIEIIAEIANAHQGCEETAFNLAKEAQKTGVEAIKYQIYFAEELLVKRHPRFEHFKKQSFSKNSWKDLIKKTKQLGVKVYADIYGIQAFKLARECSVDGYKIHSSDLSNFHILSLINNIKNGERVILSCGGSNIREIFYALKQIRGLESRPILMHGFQSYPTNINDTNLERISWLKEHFGHNCDIGFQDHISGDDWFAIALPLLAVAKGAKCIEKHITFNRDKKGIDYYSSLEPKELKFFVSCIKKTINSFGDNYVAFSEAEVKYRNTVKKKAVAARDIIKGEILKENDINYKRVSDQTIETAYLEDLIGKKTNKLLKYEEIISRDCLENNIFALIIARSNSQRLPKKALLNISGEPALTHLIKRVKQSKMVTKIILCTTTGREDDELEKLAYKNNIEIFRGENYDVLGRMLGAVNNKNADIILRITGDDILVDPDYIDKGLTNHLQKNSEYTDLKELPSGTEVEIFNYQLLKDINKCNINKDETEYLTYFITKNRSHINMNSLRVDKNHNKNWRLTLDTIDDYKVITKFTDHMLKIGKLDNYRLQDIVDFFNKNNHLFDINKFPETKKNSQTINTEMHWKNLLFNENEL